MQEIELDATHVLRFWSRVDTPSLGCWEWQGGKNQGYGRFDVKKKSYRAHRLSWTLTFGAIPDQMCVLHKCDNRGCVNPDHLFIGTRHDNLRDMYAKGRQVNPRGESHGRAKLTRVQVLRIRDVHSYGNHTLNSLALMYHVSRAVIWHVINRHTWKHI